jgi:hypothetical protein
MAREPAHPDDPATADTARHVGYPLVAAALTLASFLLIGTAGDPGFRQSTVLELLAWFIAPAVLAFVAGLRRDPLASRVIYVAGIVGATVLAWAGGAVGVERDADPAMRSSYHAMLILIAAGIAAVVGLVAVTGGYWVGRRMVAMRSR